MATFEAIGSRPEHSFAYYGEREGWLVTLARTRDSDAVEQSNWRVITNEVMAKYPDDTAIEQMGHWAVGWVEYLLVKPDSPAIKVMSDWADQLAIYPIADEADYEQLAAEERIELASIEEGRGDA